ncbi:rRNA methyltransferase 2, mitochondrial isoform X2 [Hyla sarda]|uniref:rRNA methyltransferase 2, mitochondrial isoform X2 n=1 Tax=Hyla sarda TaxID=327740 RepID=UPI0024C32B85|nr:rRNA methyltransferase 2, mitochondrial isoform X2 [Hyla sarda]
MAASVSRLWRTPFSIAQGRSLHLTQVGQKAKTGAEQIWLTRQLRDPYVKAAHAQNYRCRSAFKLLEIDKEQKILQPGNSVVDCGAAPGAWSQVLVDKVNSLGLDATASVGFVLGVDLLHITPLEGAVFLSKCDLTDPATHKKIIDLLPSGQADVILSDMAPNASGIKELDHQRLVNMCLSLLDLSDTVLRPGGSFLCKMWDGGESHLIKDKLWQRFQHVKTVKAKASRTESAEIYLLAKSHKPKNSLK